MQRLLLTALTAAIASATVSAPALAESNPFEERRDSNRYSQSVKSAESNPFADRRDSNRYFEDRRDSRRYFEDRRDSNRFAADDRLI